MAIINTPKNDPEDPIQALLDEAQKKPSGRVSKIALGFAAILVAGFSIYFLFDKTTLFQPASEKHQAKENNKKNTATEEQVILEIKSLVKLGSLASLTKQEIEANTIALIEAEESGSTVTMHAVEIILNQQKKELEELKSKMVNVLLNLYDFQKSHKDQLSSIFENEITKESGSGNSTAVNTLEMGRDAVNSVPPIVAPEQHFKGSINHRL